MRRCVCTVGLLFLLCAGLLVRQIYSRDALQRPESTRQRARQLLNDGHFAEALPLLRSLAENPQTPGRAAREDLQQAVDCLQRLNRRNEVDELIEAVVQVHTDNWPVLHRAAQIYRSLPHFGHLIGGQFERGQHRGGGVYASCEQRDRVRALQLLLQALQVMDRDDAVTGDERAAVYSDLASAIGPHGSGAAWRLQVLTDLTKLPDVQKQVRFRGWFGGGSGGAPVDEQGNPVFYSIPESWETAASDGERWRWALEQIVKHQPTARSDVDLRWARFLQSQFGVQPGFQRGLAPAGDGDLSAAVILHQLSDSETWARLADGTRKITLPPEFNHIEVLKQVLARQDGHHREALQLMLQIRRNRQQYPRAVALLKELLELAPNPETRKGLENEIHQITGNWVQFETVPTQAAGKPAVVDIRFRNGSEITFTARPVDIERLLKDTRTYLESRPRRPDSHRIRLSQIGHRLIRGRPEQYLGDPAAQWTVTVQPPAGHFDGHRSVTTPVQQGGAWWITATMRDGNTSELLLWIADASLTRKHVENGTLYFAADAATGKPLAGADLEVFGFSLRRLGRSREYRITTRRFADRTDDHGLCVIDRPADRGMQWVVIVRTQDGRLAFDGFQHFWTPTTIDSSYGQGVRVFTVTDRPVYRPEHTMKFRLWVRQPRYHEDTPVYANRNFVLQIRNPRGDVVEERRVRTDRWGGIDGEWVIPSDAVLGDYYLAVCQDIDAEHKPQLGSGRFAVEEYRKPEFEVTVEAPDEPVRLGERIPAVVQARYYFGSPVTQAEVHYRVERVKKDSRWFPETPWDWLYGPGYWWFVPDAEWYPGWRRWGCHGPIPPWIGWTPDPPELVAEGTGALDAQGRLKITIDTSAALKLHPDSDHEYRITAQVRDASRRTISATGSLLVSRDPFRVFVWTDRGHYRSGDTVNVSVQARTPDGRPVSGSGTAALFRVEWDGDQARETQVEQFEFRTDASGRGSVRIVIPRSGQYRLSCRVADDRGNVREGGQLLYVRGPDDDSENFRFSDLEIIADRRTYEPGQTAVLQINTGQADSTVLLFVRAAGGVCPSPEVIRIPGKSVTWKIPIRAEDMPNIFVEALTISDGRVHTVLKELFVPPKQRVANVQVLTDRKEYRPGDTARVRLKLTDENGRPFRGNAILTAFDASLQAVVADAIPDIRKFFWSGRRHHSIRTQSTLDRVSGPLVRPGQKSMMPLASGEPVVPRRHHFSRGPMDESTLMMKTEAEGRMAVPMAADMRSGSGAAEEDDGSGMASTRVRSEFADTALWVASVDADQHGIVETQFTMPDNLTTWRIRSWALGHGTRVGSADADVVCRKNLIIRPQIPRFLTQKDQATLSAVIHNDLDTAKDVQVLLEAEGGQVRFLTADRRTVRVEAGGQARVDWPVEIVASGVATIRMKALTDEESDAAQVRVPCHIHGMLKTVSVSGIVRRDQDTGTVQLHVPAERIPAQSRLEIRFSPSLAAAMLDALPYLIEYPWGCTEQTLNRFLPAVLVQRTLQRMGIDLEEIGRHRTNLNSQQLGDPAQRRSSSWGRPGISPVFDDAELQRIVRDGIEALTEMQLDDGGWGWFSGYGEQASPHLTALVVHGLTLAERNGVPVLPDVLARGTDWLSGWQQRELKKLREGDRRRRRPDSDRPAAWKMRADNMDALVAWVLTERDAGDPAMIDYLYRDRLGLSVYAMSLTGLVLHAQGAAEKRDVVLRNIEQFLEQNDDNQTAWLRLSENDRWYWYGSDNEAQAMYLRLLLKVRPADPLAGRIVKYLLNNRRAGGHWNSTRDTATVVETLSEYIRVSGEDRPDLNIEILIDGQTERRERITAENLFTFRNSIVLEGDAVREGMRRIEIRRSGTGPLYYNVWLSYFTLEDPITATGLEVAVQRRFYRLERNDRTVDVRGGRGQAVKQQTVSWKRIPLNDRAPVASGDLIEVELLIESLNDYEYLMIEDRKPSGFEPVDQRSGYVFEGLRAWRELRDDRVTWFLTELARGRHSISYRVRAEMPGRVSALPARIEGMYAPELVGNSDEFRLQVTDADGPVGGDF